MTGVLKQLSSDVTSVGSVDDDGLLRLTNELAIPGDEGLVPVVESENGLVERPETTTVSILGADAVALPVKVRDMPEGFRGTAVLSFPKNEKSNKPGVKGVTSKPFRHWLGNVLRPSRIVMVTEDYDGLRKDIGHMKLVGYELRRIKAFDTTPGRMDKIVTVVMMERKPKYKPLVEGQIIE